MIRMGIVFRVGVYQAVIALLENVFAVVSELLVQFLFQPQYGIGKRETVRYNFPCLVDRRFDIARLSHQKVIAMTEQFGKPCFPETMDAFLIAELSVIILGGVQRRMCIGNVRSEEHTSELQSRAN